MRFVGAEDKTLAPAFYLYSVFYGKTLGVVDFLILIYYFRKRSVFNMNLPNDPVILLSVVNTKLRDFYTSFDEMCSKEDISDTEKENILKKLSSVGYTYSKERNRFI